MVLAKCNPGLAPPRSHWCDLAVSIIAFASCASAQVNLHSTASIPIPGSITAIAGDFTSDFKLDLATVGLSQRTLQVFPGKGDGTFGAAIQSSFPCAIISRLATGRFRATGNLDIVGYCQNTVAILPGNGDGTFAAAVQVTIPSGGYRGTPAVADLNGDGFEDLVIPGEFTGTGGVYALFGNGDGTFQSPVVIGAAAVQSLVITDVNRDGWPDIVVLEPNAQTLAIFLNQGNGTFKQIGQASSVVSLPLFLSSADLNGDGFPDFVIVGDKYPNNIAVLFGNGKGGFLQQPPLIIQTAGSPWAVPANLRGTGILDVVVAGAWSIGNANLIVEPGNGDGTFGSPIRMTFAPGINIAVADFDGDGLDDIALVTLTGQIVNQVAQPAQIDVLLSTARPAFYNVNSASFGGGAVAAGSIASAFQVKGGAKLAATTSTDPPSTTLGGDSMTVTDSAGVARPAVLFYVSPGQINYLVPQGTASGPATIALHTVSGTLTSKQEISPVAPGIYAIDGIAEAEVVTALNGTQTVGFTFQQNSSGGYAPAPIDLGSDSTQVFLILYGTGIQNHTSPVLAHIGNVTVPADFAGAQGTYPGEDQINVQIPTSLRGAGVVEVSLTVDGITSNAVKIQIK